MDSKKFVLTIVLLLLLSFIAYSQPRFQAGVNFNTGFPRGEFGENVKNTGLGLNGYFLYNVEHKPFAIGAKFGFLVYGNETREEPFSATIPDVLVDVRTTNNIFSGQLVLRLQSPEGLGGGTLIPYFDGVFGFHYLFTETRVEDVDAWDVDYDVASSTNYDDTAMSYGGGGGMMIRVYDSSEDDEGLEALYIDFGIMFIEGREARYLKKGDIERTEDKVIYHPSESATDLINLHLGVAFYF